MMCLVFAVMLSNYCVTKRLLFGVLAAALDKLARTQLLLFAHYLFFLLLLFALLFCESKCAPVL